MNLNSRPTKIGLAAAGLVAGVVLAGALGAQAATSTPSPTTTAGTSSSPSIDAHPGDNGADGVAESSEVHGGGDHGRGLDLSGTVTAVGASTISIKTNTATTTYTVTSSSDLDKNGEATLSSFKAGDAVRFSLSDTSATNIDKLHAGDETKNMPSGGPASSSSSTTPSGA